ncbi:hypothetical protein [Actinoplanes sp. NPDC049802]|uniref:hypothetical protein n=1 Tax=Actinoplanes sp. NPDC049802 TaxID=3154742 RepID=UPI003406375D
MLEVPTLRADARMQWVLIGVCVVNMLILARDRPAPVVVGVVILAGASVLAVVLAMRHTSRRQPPVRVTTEYLELPDGADSTVRIAWPDIATCTIARRQFLPHLLVEVPDPDRIRPAPNRWQRAAATRDGRYRLAVALGGSRAIRNRLRAEVTGRTVR